MERLAADGHILERAVGVERNGGMIEQIAIDHGVDASVVEKALHVLVQFLAGHKGVVQAFHQFHLLGDEAVRV